MLLGGASLYKNATLDLKLRNPHQLPGALREQLDQVGQMLKAGLSQIEQLPPKDRQVADRLKDLLTGEVNAFLATEHAVLQLTVRATGLSALLNQN